MLLVVRLVVVDDGQEGLVVGPALAYEQALAVEQLVAVPGDASDGVLADHEPGSVGVPHCVARAGLPEPASEEARHEDDGDHLRLDGDHVVAVGLEPFDPAEELLPGDDARVRISHGRRG